MLYGVPIADKDDPSTTCNINSATDNKGVTPDGKSNIPPPPPPSSSGKWSEIDGTNA